MGALKSWAAILLCCLAVVFLPSTAWGDEPSGTPSASVTPSESPSPTPGDPSPSEPTSELTSTPSSSPSDTPEPSSSGSPASVLPSSGPSLTPGPGDESPDGPAGPSMVLAEGETTVVELSDDDRVILLMGFGSLLVFGAAQLVSGWGRDS